LTVTLLAVAAITISLWQITSTADGLILEHRTVGTTPVTVHRSSGSAPAPAVVIAHGFAGSRQLMAPFAVSLAQAGYVAVSFDFQGHGRNQTPLTGDVTTEDGAGASLLAELQRIIAFARDLPTSTGQVALLGHSMATDIIIRAAIADPSIDATVAVSLYSRAVTATEPRNLLMIVGEWERFLAEEALKAVDLTVGGNAVEGMTYGDFTAGSARRAVLADNTEHVSVLYSSESLAEARGWLNLVFDREREGDLDHRGPWLGLLFAGIISFAWPLSRLLPRSDVALPATVLPKHRFFLLAIGPAVLTPLLLWPLPLNFLPVLVADYLAVHFALYGMLTLVGIWLCGIRFPRINGPRFVMATSCVTLFGILAIGLPIDAFVASFWPHPGRWSIMLWLALGTVIYTLADEWLCRQDDAPRGAYAFTKVCFLVSLALAIALNLSELFFLIIIAPVILLFFLLYGLISSWVYGATHHPGVAGIANGLAFAWALGVTFPLLAS
jgi:hypothetical protein